MQDQSPNNTSTPLTDTNALQMQQWMEAIENVLKEKGSDQACDIIDKLSEKLTDLGIKVPFSANTPYINTINPKNEPEYPGDRMIERKIKSYIRWNAMSMVVQANREHSTLGGHISTFASAATLYEVGFNHFFRAQTDNFPGDFVYFQGHASPGNYARAFLEGRLGEEQLNNFRQELQPEGGLSSYPHPYLMPDFWQFPSVSMGLAPIMSIYQARFSRYLRARKLTSAEEPRIWCFVGDGESDEPETLGALTLASREHLDNLIWVVNCNLQRLDGPVRGNGKIIQELEAIFRGAGWNVIKVIWGSAWDKLLESPARTRLIERMDEVVDGEYQKYSVAPGSYTRSHFFGKSPELAGLVNSLSDEQIQKLLRGGHDPKKVYAAYKAAIECRDRPTVILAKTVKGYGLGEAGEGRNVTHQQKKMNEKELREFRARFEIPINDEDVVKAPFYRPPAESAEMKYLHQRRKELGGYLPRRNPRAAAVKVPDAGYFEEFYKSSEGREVSTTMAFVRVLSKLLKDKNFGRQIVPIIPDEARTFGMEALFRQCGIYAHKGQLYEPVDSESLLRYVEAKDGQILEEGITEAGSMSSFIAAGTAYATHGIQMMPFFIYYSMFGFQRIGDLIWAAADSRTRGFLLGATAGRTTLNGEGLQHQDGHSHLLASAIPTVLAYDPAFAYEIAVIVREGMRRMYENQEDVFYYMTLQNENYLMPPMGHDVEEGILKGMYKYRSGKEGLKFKAHLFGSGSIIRESLRAQEILESQYDVSVDVWSVTSYKQLRVEAQQAARWNMLHPEEKPRKSYIESVLENESGVFVAMSDYMKIISDQIAPWVPGGLTSLGTDGFGRSETRENLRRFFEVDADMAVIAVLSALSKNGSIDKSIVAGAIKERGVDPEKIHPQIL